MRRHWLSAGHALTTQKPMPPLDAMTERVQTFASNTTLQELCAINKDQEDVSRVVTHLNTQLDKDIKVLDEMCAFGHDFSQRVMLYRSWLLSSRRQ